MKKLNQIQLVTQPPNSALCGAACISMILKYYDKNEIKIDEIYQDIISDSPNGRKYCRTSLMGKYLIKNNIETTIIRYSNLSSILSYCVKNLIPAIMNHHSFVNNQMGHFTIAIDFSNSMVEINDPEMEIPRKISINILEDHFIQKYNNDEITGKVMLLCRDNNIVSKKIYKKCPNCGSNIDLSLYQELCLENLIECILCVDCDRFYKI